MKLEDLVERAAQYDPILARDIKDYVHGRKYGLVYEASKPEFVRMWKKPVVRGDLVNILPPRGVMEDTKSEDDPAEVVYKVVRIADGKAELRSLDTGETAEASVDDIVAIARFDRPVYAGLKEIDRVERGGDKPYHVVINGENYHALQTLLYAYRGKVDCIYIDPPYNSGARDWKYNNNYVGKDDQYRHSKWLTFMEDRLRLAKKLLNPKDSVLIVTIDEKEYLRLGLLLEQIFPNQDIQMITSMTNPKGSRRSGRFTRCDEYIFYVFLGEARVSAGVVDLLTGVENKTSVRWPSLKRTGTNSHRRDRENLCYPLIFDSATKEFIRPGRSLFSNETIDEYNHDSSELLVWPLDSKGELRIWQLSQESLVEYRKKGFVSIGKYKNGKAAAYYLSSGLRKQIEDGEIIILDYDSNGAAKLAYTSGEKEEAPRTMWNQTAHSASESGTNLLASILKGRAFPFPKSLYVVEDSLRLFLADKPAALVVDFFAGSGTTAHAVMRLNHQDDGKRFCVSVTNNEVSETEAKKLTKKKLRQGEDGWEQYGIARFIAWPRVKSVITGKTPEGQPIKGEYGIKSDEYQEIEGDVINSETGKKMRGKFFKKVKAQSKSVPDPFPMAEGFEENAIFFELEYLEPSVVGADLAFGRIAPILWLAGGCEGEILHHDDDYAIGETYAVLFNPAKTNEFVDAVEANEAIEAVFIVTDSLERYRSLCAKLPKRNVRQLYESYLRNFEINAIG